MTSHGIPHHTAGDVLTVAREQGHSVALDRTWQLESVRREVEGTTAALLGERGLAWDRFSRRARLAALARRAYDALDPATTRFVQAYVDGVNAGLAEAPVVPELEELDARPGPWEPWTPLGVFLVQHVLFASFPQKLFRRHVERLAGCDVAALLHHEGLATAGSNAWVVGGGRTASGLPLLGGDPHRTFEMPNGYQQVRLTCTDPDDPFDVAGFTFPGVPGVQHFGHAGAVAWGITNAMGDYQDVFVERLERRGDQVVAATPDGWGAAERHVEHVEVRGGDVVEVEVVTTPNGPVVSGGPDGEAFALRTPTWVLGEVGFAALLPLLRARCTQDVVDALAHWVEPVNNLVVADAAGDVRQQVVGRVPRRAEENRWRPVPAWEPDHGWDGWVALPGRSVGPDEHLVTANHRMDASFDAVGVDFAPPGRSRRLDALLDGRSDLTPDDFAAMHRDVLAGQPAVLAEALAALDASSGTPGAQALLAELRAWDQRFEVDSTTAAAYVDVRDAFVQRLAAAPPLDAVTREEQPHGPLLGLWFDLPRQLQGSLGSVLSDLGRTLVPDLDDHLLAAVEEVAARPRRPWGERHRYRPAHVLGHRLPDEPALPGDNDCVRCAGGVPGSDAVVRGSVARYVWDLAGHGTSGWVVPLGASGDPRSPHHHNQTRTYAEGGLLPVTRCSSHKEWSASRSGS
ncbi:penicillin acylase family protein [Nocardioides caldifontis]|uniref:penicillin acylase family protein n=1 Tax=Nocardioides caldifontis TaxID=2588938 RepID=UPI0011E000CC|nr:penicillin acylase family protein [Nocardioides caldifontis]